MSESLDMCVYRAPVLQGQGTGQMVALSNVWFFFGLMDQSLFIQMFLPINNFLKPSQYLDTEWTVIAETGTSVKN